MLVRARIEGDGWVATHASAPDPRDERRRGGIVVSDIVGVRARVSGCSSAACAGRLWVGGLLGGGHARANWGSRVVIRVSRA